MLSHFSHVRLQDPMDYSLPGSSVYGILQARILEWGPFPSPGDPPDPGIEPAPLTSPELAGMFFTTEMDRYGLPFPQAIPHTPTPTRLKTSRVLSKIPQEKI